VFAENASLGNNAFLLTNSELKICVKPPRLNYYKQAENWSEYEDKIVPFEAPQVEYRDINNEYQSFANDIWINVTNLTLKIGNCTNPKITLDNIQISGTVINNISEGMHTLIIVGEEEVSVTYTFYVDRTAPTVSGVSEDSTVPGGTQLRLKDNGDNFTTGISGQNIKEVKLIDNTPGGAIIDYKTGPISLYNLPKTNTGGYSGYCKLFVTDNAGNTGIITFLIDWSIPPADPIDTTPPELTFSNVASGNNSLGVANIDVINLGVTNKSVTLVSSSKALGSLTATKDGKKIDVSIGTVFRENGNYVVKAIDEAGNTATYEFTIDKGLDFIYLAVGIAGGAILVITAGVIGSVRRKKKMARV